MVGPDSLLTALRPADIAAITSLKRDYPDPGVLSAFMIPKAMPSNIGNSLHCCLTAIGA
jgi:hypothetical protein